tara:strand:+ start:2357 stop:2995 length:639 start_codon:yes stop_codon:yes gene_type:complete
MTHLSTAELAKLAKVQKRQIQRILESGFPDLGATRTAGGHWMIPDTIKVRQWAMNHERWNRGSIPKEIEKLVSKEGLVIPADTDKEAWVVIHVAVLLAKKLGINLRKKWIKQSRIFGEEKYGLDLVADVEVQVEMKLGYDPTKKTKGLNPGDKSIGVVTIQGISQSFNLWHRKMKNEIETWEKAKLDQAINLLDPMVVLCSQLIEKRRSLGE